MAPSSPLALTCILMAQAGHDAPQAAQPASGHECVLTNPCPSGSVPMRTNRRGCLGPPGVAGVSSSGSAATWPSLNTATFLVAPFPRSAARFADRSTSKSSSSTGCPASTCARLYLIR